MTVNLDALLAHSENHGTFHDATLVMIQQRDDCTEFDFSLCVGDPDASDPDERESRRMGKLIFYGVHDWKCDPRDTTLSNVGTWLTADGAPTEIDSDVAREFVNNVPPDLPQHYFYFTDTNTFLFFAFDKLEFRWC
jgi:hypothetical protein